MQSVFCDCELEQPMVLDGLLMDLRDGEPSRLGGMTDTPRSNRTRPDAFSDLFLPSTSSTTKAVHADGPPGIDFPTVLRRLLYTLPLM